MKYPDWFLIIKKWREKGLGKYGVTLPFLYGAIKMKNGTADLKSIIQEMISAPVEGYIIEISWCADAVKAPVLRATQETSTERITYKTVSVPNPSSGKPSLVFDNDLVKKWGDKPQILLESLIREAAPAIHSGKYSRHHNDSTGESYNGEFSQRELDFIKETLMLTKPMD